MRALARRAEDPLVQIGFADNHGAVLLQALDDEGIAVGDVARQNFRPGRRLDARNVHVVLDAHGHAGKKPAPLAATLARVDVLGCAQRIRAGDGDQRFGVCVPNLDVGQSLFGCFNRSSAACVFHTCAKPLCVPS